MRFRLHKGGYGASMQTTTNIAPSTPKALLKYLKFILPETFPENAIVTATKYGMGLDSRNGWDTYIIEVEDYGVVGFSDGPFKEEPTELTEPRFTVNLNDIVRLRLSDRGKRVYRNCTDCDTPVPDVIELPLVEFGNVFGEHLGYTHTPFTINNELEIL